MNGPQRRVIEGAPEQFSVVVIGGGQTGLAAGYELAQRGIEFVILESGGRLGENWRPRWDSRRLFTPARFEGLPGTPVQDDDGRYLTKNQMSEYLETYAERSGLAVRLGIDVLGVAPDEHGKIVVESEQGRFVADQVIVVADLLAVQRRTTRDRERRIIHLRAGEYRTLSQLSQAGEVVVLGGLPL